MIADFKQSAVLAKKAGFDGYEVHGANGYLLDQFLRDSVNKRTDTYGGSVENRARLLLEVFDAVVEVFGADRVGVKLSPNGGYNDLSDSDPIGTFSYVIEALNAKKIAYVEVAEYFTFDATNGEHHEKFFAELEKKSLRAYFKPLFTNGAYIANYSYDLEKAATVLRAGEADLVSFATLYIANPDLVERFRDGTPLNSVANADPSKLWTEYFYGPTAVGYTDVSVYEAK